MRNYLVPVFVLGASACAARAPGLARPTQYTCDDVALVRDGRGLRTDAGHLAVTRTSWRDGDGDHFVAWPVSPTDVRAVEFVIPFDPLQDAAQRTYDASNGASIADWKLLGRRACTARGGYNDALARWMSGHSLDDVAREMSVDPSEARGMVRHALSTLQRRYWRDR